MDNIFPSYDLAHSIQDLVEMIHDLVYKLQEGVLLVRAESIQYVQSVYLAHNIFRSQDLTLVVQELVRKKKFWNICKRSRTRMQLVHAESK